MMTAAATAAVRMTTAKSMGPPRSSVEDRSRQTGRQIAALKKERESVGCCVSAASAANKAPVTTARTLLTLKVNVDLKGKDFALLQGQLYD